jgi:uncharacterized membrane protein
MGTFVIGMIFVLVGIFFKYAHRMDDAWWALAMAAIFVLAAIHDELVKIRRAK